MKNMKTKNITISIGQEGHNGEEKQYEKFLAQKGYKTELNNSTRDYAIGPAEDENEIDNRDQFLRQCWQEYCDQPEKKRILGAKKNSRRKI